MKKTTIWIISAIMGTCFLILLYLQVNYIEEIATIRSEQFDQAVKKSLTETARNMEMNEISHYLEEATQKVDYAAGRTMTPNLNTNTSEADRSHQEPTQFELKTMKTRPSSIDKVLQLTPPDSQVAESATRNMENYVKDAYVYKRGLLDRVIYTILYKASDRPFAKRINVKALDNELRTQLEDNGIDLPYHFTVNNYDGSEVYRCSDYVENTTGHQFTQILFGNDMPDKRGTLYVFFPDMKQYIFSTVSYMIPALIFTVILLITFIFVIYIIFRQKKLSEIKNDFVNNMTHEFKTPISTISLAAQMLNDPSVAKSPTMFTHISTVINDETKRLRFQVEKVLQLSMYDRRGGAMKMKAVDANALITGVVNTFNLKVEKYGGTLESDLQATDSTIWADEMHFTNVIFNLMDNAVKYRRTDAELHLKVSTKSDGNKLVVLIEDNGIGIKKEDLKKVFERFYRVHTGNLHDVKGFGLGLAYVKQIIDVHKGTIRAESELGKGTKFIITLPIFKN